MLQQSIGDAQVAFGKLGGTPAVSDQQFTATIMGQTRLSTVEEFNNILLRVNQDGSKVRLKQKCLNVEARAGGKQVTMESTIEIEGKDRPAAVVEAISIIYG
mgnify:CR=1 FL=1